MLVVMQVTGDEGGAGVSGSGCACAAGSPDRATGGGCGSSAPCP
eukprot:COSAG01_NODE_6957_length_3417_cov_9.172393_5_plen_44_part_00